MANRKLIIKLQKSGPIHLDGLTTWIDNQDEDAPECPKCKTDRYVSMSGGEWKCSKCDNVIGGGDDIIKTSSIFGLVLILKRRNAHEIKNDQKRRSSFFGWVQTCTINRKNQ